MKNYEESMRVKKEACLAYILEHGEASSCDISKNIAGINTRKAMQLLAELAQAGLVKTYARAPNGTGYARHDFAPQKERATFDNRMVDSVLNFIMQNPRNPRHGIDRRLGLSQCAVDRAISILLREQKIYKIKTKSNVLYFAKNYQFDEKCDVEKITPQSIKFKTVTGVSLPTMPAFMMTEKPQRKIAGRKMPFDHLSNGGSLNAGRW